MNNNSDNGLSRRLRLFPVTNIVIANMIGTGIFTTTGLLMMGLNNPLLMLLLWVGGGLLAMCGALCYSELGAAMPQAGGEYIFLSKLFHPRFGFLSGWVSFLVGFSAPIAASSIGCSEYLAGAFPRLFELGNPELLKKCLSILIIVMFALIHMRGIDFGARVQNYLTLLKVLLIVALVAAGFSLGKGSLGNLFQGGRIEPGFAGWKTIGLSLMWIMFAYSGWNAAAYIGSEIRDPERTLPLSLIRGTGIVIALYFCLNLLYIFAVPAEEMKGVIAVGGLAAGNMFGRSLESLVSVLISFALFSSISAFIILGPRVCYSMARDGYFFKMAAEVHPVFRVPTKSIILQCLIAIIMVISGTFDQILTYMGFSLGIFPILAVIGVFKLRKTGKSSYVMPLYPAVPIVFVLASVSILILAYLERPVESSIALLTVMTGIPIYSIFNRKKHKSIRDSHHPYPERGLRR